MSIYNQSCRLFRFSPIIKYKSRLDRWERRRKVPLTVKVKRRVLFPDPPMSSLDDLTLRNFINTNVSEVIPSGAHKSVTVNVRHIHTY